MTPISSDKPDTIVLSAILQDFLVHTNGPKGPHSAAERTRKDLAILYRQENWTRPVQ